MVIGLQVRETLMRPWTLISNDSMLAMIEYLTSWFTGQQ